MDAVVAVLGRSSVWACAGIAVAGGAGRSDTGGSGVVSVRDRGEGRVRGKGTGGADCGLGYGVQRSGVGGMRCVAFGGGGWLAAQRQRPEGCRRARHSVMAGRVRTGLAAHLSPFCPFVRNARIGRRR